ncbi:MAG: hypothetical protein JRH15_13305 [Deltaproteobacteria bacterium]|nr:hypothetical protein [Deltaproteobacteria bacterium]
MEKLNPDISIPENWNWNHEDIRDALANNDGATAERLVREHIEETLSKVMLDLMSLPNIANANIAG